MAYTVTETYIGIQPPIAGTISALSAGAVSIITGFRPGQRVRATDPTFGGGEFIFLPCLSGMVANSLATFRESASGVFTVAACPNTGNLGQPVAVAMAAGVANKYGWFQVAGTVPIKKAATKINSNVALFISSTAGRVQATAACGKQVLGVRSSNSATVLSATSTVTVTINNPHMQGQIT